MKKIGILALLCLFASSATFAQGKQNRTSLLWEVSGKDLVKPSYLFGTYHLLSNAFVDTMPEVKKAYAASGVVVGELVMDSTLQGPMMEAALLKGTTLKQVLPDTVYTKTTAWFAREAGMDLEKLNGLNPLSILTFAMAITQQKYYPIPAGAIQLDTYFQVLAKRDGKQVIGLETIQAQIQALYGQLSLARQTHLLYDAISKDDGLKNLAAVMNRSYTSQDLNALQQLMYGTTYRQNEIEALLDDRNNHWMKQLPKLMKQNALFVAVGALHLAGKTGLVQQLREQGYTVTPIKL